MKPENRKKIFSGDMERAELIVNEGPLLAMGDADPVLTRPVVVV